MNKAIHPEERTAIYDLFRALHQLTLVQEENERLRAKVERLTQKLGQHPACPECGKVVSL